MENRLKHLNRIIDQEISKTPVFTEKDEQNILSTIKNTSSSSSRINKRKKTIVPRLLTAALFAGVIFTSYTVIDNYLTPETTSEIEKENKLDIRYAQEFTQGSSLVTYDAEKRELSIHGTIMNPTDFDSEPFQVKVNVLNDDVANDLGTSSISLDIPPNRILKPDESYSFNEVLKINLGILDENTFKDAFEIVIFSDTKTLASFVVNDVDYISPAIDEPNNATELADQNEQPADQSETAKVGDKEETNIENNKEAEAQEKLKELESKYGKSQTPFTYIDVVSKDEKFFLKGATVGMNKEDHLKILGPNDEAFKSNGNGQNSYMWNVESDKAEPAPYFVNYTMDSDVSYQMSFHTREKDVIKWADKLGEPYQTTDLARYFYHKSSKQLLSIIYVKEDIYEVDLRIQENPDRYIKEYTENNKPR
jgi:hypothetical protein